MKNYTKLGLLSKTERTILQLLLEGYPQRSMGWKLYVSDSTVSRILSNLRDKYHLFNADDIYKLLEKDLEIRNSWIDRELALQLEQQASIEKLEQLAEQNRAITLREHNLLQTITKPNNCNLEKLSPKEKEIFCFLRTLEATEKSNTQLAKIFNVTVSTFKKHLQNIYRKLNVTNRASLVVLSTQASQDS